MGFLTCPREADLVEVSEESEGVGRVGASSDILGSWYRAGLLDPWRRSNPRYNSQPKVSPRIRLPY
jgi:hypothetical protein